MFNHYKPYFEKCYLGYFLFMYVLGYMCIAVHDCLLLSMLPLINYVPLFFFNRNLTSKLSRHIHISLYQLFPDIDISMKASLPNQCGQFAD